MNTILNDSPTSRPLSPRLGLQTVAYDRVTAAMSALVFVLGFFATFLVLIWLTTIVGIKPKTIKIIPIQSLGGGDPVGLSGSVDEPSGDELADVEQRQPLALIGDVKVSVSENLGVTGVGEGEGKIGRIGVPGIPGTGVEPPEAFPPHERWEIRFTATSIDDYAKQLDFFEIELGALHRSKPIIDYARNLSGATPIRSSLPRNQEKRLYFVHTKSGPLVEQTKQLLTKAGVPTEKRFLAQFYSDDAVKQLLTLEKASLDGMMLPMIRKTIFGVRPAGDRFEFYVIRIENL